MLASLGHKESIEKRAENMKNFLAFRGVRTATLYVNEIESLPSNDLR